MLLYSPGKERGRRDIDSTTSTGKEKREGAGRDRRTSMVHFNEKKGWTGDGLAGGDKREERGPTSAARGMIGILPNRRKKKRTETLRPNPR